MEMTRGDDASDETVALPNPPANSRPPSVPRITSGTLGDEGRFLPGTLVAGRYRIVSMLGRGGMGEVYRATDLTLAQSVALKFLPEAAAANQSLLERFHGEVRIARQVSHPNVCRVYDIGEVDGLPFLSMEYIDGEDLATTLQRIGRLPADKAIETARKICAGLYAAHSKGVIHRDLKPSNIMLDRRGEVLLMDFGLAAVAESVRGVEARQGTPAYMSPEQIRGSEVTAKSDIYALGLIFYELFTGKKAFDAKSMADLMRLQDAARPAAMSSLAEGIDPAVEQIVLRCLSSDPAKRPASALSVAAALPGGDPLAAALAAGETPSPELVAAAGEESSLSSRGALACLIGVIVALLTLPYAVERQSMTRFVPLDYPPAVLEEKAREIARALGYGERPADRSARWIYQDAIVKHFEKGEGRKDWRKLLAAESPLHFRYRQSPRLLEAQPDGRVRDDRPPHDISGMIRMTVNSGGYLREFSAVPPQADESPDSPSAIDPARVFSAIGFPMDGFAPAQPRFTPVTPFDSRQAWKGKHPGLGEVEVTVEIAAWRGKITDVTMLWPWTKPTRMAERSESERGRFAVAATSVLVAIGLAAALYFARRNCLAGRGDRTGALRATAFVFGAIFLSLVLATHFIPSFTLFSVATDLIAYSLFASALVWLLYIALEPFVRAGWPHALIAWNRLLAGRWSDPRVGADALIGMAVAMFFLVAFVAQGAYLIGKGEAPSPPNVAALQGTRYSLAMAVNYLGNGVISAFGIILLLFGIRRLLRRDWLAAPITALVFSLLQAGEASLGQLSVTFVVYAVLVFTLLRFGLVTGIAAIVTINVCNLIVLSTDFNAWYNSTGVLLWLLLAGSAVTAYWISQRNRVPKPS